MSDGAARLATFGAGCFWGVEARFASLEGVTDTAVGYMGGELDQPTYQDVCRGDSGHTEVVQLRYDPAVIAYAALLKAFFEMHDPTQVNRQGPDRGYQYRSVVFWHSQEQQALALEAIDALSREHVASIATVVEAATTFWRAEEYHQQYLKKRGTTCSI